MKRILALFAALFLFLTSGGVITMAETSGKSIEGQFSCINVYPGSNVTQLNFNWITNYEPEKTLLQIAPSENVKGDKDLLDVYAEEFEGKNAITAFSAQGKVEDDCYANKVTAKKLKANTSYTYRVGDGKNWSDLYTIKTGSERNIKAHVLTDIHIIGGDMVPGFPDVQVSIDGWETTLNNVIEQGTSDLILSLGDQMQDSSQRKYVEGFFGRSNLANIAMAPINGNHDINPYVDNALKDYTNVPNAQPYGAYRGISDYYFKYGNVLFVMVSVTDVNFHDKDHNKTFEAAIAAYPDYDWLVVGCHEAIYGMYMAVYDENKDPLQQTWDLYGDFIEVFDEYGVDIVLTGHSHAYSRSKVMKNGEIQDSTKNELGQFVDPNGTIYVNLGMGYRDSQLLGQEYKPGFPWSFIDEFYSQYVGVNMYSILETEKDTLTLKCYNLTDIDGGATLGDETLFKTVIKKTSIEYEENTDTDNTENSSTAVKVKDKTQNALTWVSLGVNIAAVAVTGVLIYTASKIKK